MLTDYIFKNIPYHIIKSFNKMKEEADKLKKKEEEEAAAEEPAEEILLLREIRDSLKE